MDTFILPSDPPMKNPLIRDLSIMHLLIRHPPPGPPLNKHPHMSNPPISDLHIRDPHIRHPPIGYSLINHPHINTHL